MTWSKDRPAEPGYYWCWHLTVEGAEPVHVFEDSDVPGSLEVRTFDARPLPLRERYWDHTLWLGPLPQPSMPDV